MSYKTSSTARDWIIEEAVVRGRGALTEVLGRGSRKRTDTDLVNVYSELRLLVAAGCPADSELGAPNYQAWKKHRPPGWPNAYMVYVLKATPGRYRLYFYVHDSAKKQIIILYVVEKKTDKRDPKDFNKCCRILDKLASGAAKVWSVDIPTR